MWFRVIVRDMINAKEVEWYQVTRSSLFELLEAINLLYTYIQEFLELNRNHIVYDREGDVKPGYKEFYGIKLFSYEELNLDKLR